MESVVFIFTASLSLGVFLFRAQTKYFFSLFLHILLIVTASSWAFRALSAGGVLQFNLLEKSGYSLPVTIDSLSAFFLAVISLTLLIGVLYAHGYLKLYRQTCSDLQLSFHHLALLWLHSSMLLVCILREGTAFLIAWELMSISAFGLVVFEGERKVILKTGLRYLLQMHIAFVLIIATFLITRTNDHSFGFDSFGTYFSRHEQGLVPIFLLTFIGFGSYAGFFPLHKWLLHTHLVVPSHISGIMSGILMQMGMYGLLRTLTYIHTSLPPIGLIILATSLLSGIVGTRYAFIQQDAKQMLAYSSIANTGIIGIGIGAGLLGVAFNVPTLAVLGFTGGILLILNHALSKPLLYYSFGSIYRATHTRNLKQLGGLVSTMPKTSTSFLVGALAICGLPPFNGISQVMIYLGLLKGIRAEDLYLNLSVLAVLPGLTIIWAQTLRGFLKIFDTVFWGSPRSEAALHAKEVTDDMIMPKLLAGVSILIIGLLPTFFLKLSGKVTALYVTDLTTLDEIAPTLMYICLSGALLVGSLFFALWIRSKYYKPIKINYRQEKSFNKARTEHWPGNLFTYK